jgi:hypothetical protein
MKIQIDTINKTIAVNEEVNLLEFTEYLKNIPDWELYTIKGFIEYVYWYNTQSPVIVPYNPTINPYIYYEIPSKF